LTVGGGQLRFDFLATLQNCVLGDVRLQFRIVSQV